MTYTENTPTPELLSLTRDLNSTLNAPPSSELMTRQSAILDQLFSTIIEKRVADAALNGTRYPETAQSWLKFALQIQKQCTDTIKARAAIEYMEGLSARGASTLPAPCTTPLPPLSREQSE